MWSSALKSFQSNINSNYKVADTPSSTAGPWRIFDAKHKSSNKPASIFVLDRKTLEPHGGSGSGAGGGGGFGSSRSGAASVKRAQDEVVERLKREASALARLRHPSILELMEPVEDTRSGGLQFATEPVTASLAGLLKEKDEQEVSGGVGGRRSRFVVDDPESGGKKRRDVEVDELEIQKGLLQVGKGLEFLHESAGLVHCNLTPDAVLVNAKGDWKISGLGFSGKSEGTTAATTAPPVAVSEVLNFDSRLPRFAQLNLDYCAPDLVMDGKASTAADMFSLGLLIVALYNSPHQSPLETNMSVSAYKRCFASSSSTPSPSNNFLSKSPLARPVLSLLPRLLTRKPQARMTARDFQDAEYFDNILVSTIRFLESLPAKTPNEKSQFLRGLPRILEQFPKTVLEKKVLPALLEEMKDRELIALILGNVCKMVGSMPSARRAVTEKVLPKLREVFLTPSTTGGGNKKKEEAAAPERDAAKEAGLMVLLENASLLAQNTNGKDFKDSIWPLIQLSMESPTHSLVDASLGTLPVILSALDFSTVKNDVFPVIAAVFSKTSSLGIKIRGLEALRVLCGGGEEEAEAGDGLDGFDPVEKKEKRGKSVILDKYTIQEKVVPLMKAIKTKEPAVMTAALDVFKEIGKIADSDFLAMEVLPILWNMSLGPLLNLQQFQSFMSLIKALSSRIETEHARKLQELSASNASVANRADLMAGLAPSRAANGLDDVNGGDNADFESLVLGKGKSGGSRSGGSNALDADLDAWAQPAPATARSSGSRTSSPAATFSWSTTPPVQSTATLRPATNVASRSVTPDQSLNAFAALQPAPASTGYSSFNTAPLQPMRPATQTNVPSGGAVDWSTAGTSSASAWSTNHNTVMTPTPNYNTAPSMNTSNVWSMPSSTQQTNSFAISPPPQSSQSPYSNFGIAPPPATTPTTIGQPQQQRMTMNSLGAMAGGAQGQQLQQPGQKQGIDKYESLL